MTVYEARKGWVMIEEGQVSWVMTVQEGQADLEDLEARVMTVQEGQAADWRLKDLEAMEVSTP